MRASALLRPAWGTSRHPFPRQRPAKKFSDLSKFPYVPNSNPNKEPASPCGFVHCTVSSACGTKRSPAPGALEPPQPDETYYQSHGSPPKNSPIPEQLARLGCTFLPRLMLSWY